MDAVPAVLAVLAVAAVVAVGTLVSVLAVLALVSVIAVLAVVALVAAAAACPCSYIKLAPKVPKVSFLLTSEQNSTEGMSFIPILPLANTEKLPLAHKLGLCFRPNSSTCQPKEQADSQTDHFSRLTFSTGLEPLASF